MKMANYSEPWTGICPTSGRRGSSTTATAHDLFRWNEALVRPESDFRRQHARATFSVRTLKDDDPHPPRRHRLRLRLDDEMDRLNGAREISARR